MKTVIKFLEHDLLPSYIDHLHKHLGESGMDDVIYSPYEIGFIHPKDKMQKKVQERFSTPLNKISWQRAFVTVDHNHIIGHLDLQGHDIESSLHRCRLGMGLDKEYRFKGLGSHLMKEAIAWITNSTEIDWIDLYTFEHNKSAIALYQKFGFEVVGKVDDLFRVSGHKICDYQMTLKIKRA